MNKITRREAIESMVAAGAGLTFAGAAEADAQTAVAQTPAAFRGQHQPKPLPFDPAKLKGLSEKLIRSHHENNYAGAVRALNAVEQRLAAMLNDKDLPAYVYGDHKREELVSTGSVELHEIFFECLGGYVKAAGVVLNAIKRHWGSYEQWEAEFKRTGAALGGGSGWVIFAHNFHT
ncbi:MAG: Fe-Mn family superoxide dismutase, partial [Blastocatellia bacterium]